MDGSIQGLIDKTAKLDVNLENPEYSTNWCHLPMEMRMECIKWMDFKTRTRLGATSRTEKSLIAYKKYHFDNVTLAYYNRSVRYQKWNEVLIFDAIINYSSSVFVHLQTINDHEKTLNCLVNILKNCEIDTFQFLELDDRSRLPDYWREIEKCAPFRFKTFKSSGYASTAAMFFMRNCEGVENIELNNMNSRISRTYELSDLMDLPVITKAKHVQFQFHHESDRGVYQLVQKWIDNQSEIGKSLRIDTDFRRFASSFASVFEDRVIYEKYREVRIRTNDESKHILMRCDKKDRFLYYYSCTIISSNLLESEYHSMLNQLSMERL